MQEAYEAMLRLMQRLSRGTATALPDTSEDAALACRIFRATEAGDAQLVNFLLLQALPGSDACRQAVGEAFSMACAAGHLSVVRCMLQVQLRLQSQPGTATLLPLQRSKALTMAVLQDRQDVVHLLVHGEHAACLPAHTDVEEAAAFAKHGGRRWASPLLLCAKRDAALDGMCEKGCVEAVKCELVARRNCTACAGTPRQYSFHAACESGQLHIVMAFLSLRHPGFPSHALQHQHFAVCADALQKSRWPEALRWGTLHAVRDIQHLITPLRRCVLDAAREVRWAAHKSLLRVRCARHQWSSQ